AACFAIIEFLSNASERYSIPDTTIDLLYILAAVGLPIVIVLPWFINRKKPEGITDDLGEMQFNAKLDKSIIVLPFENISPDPDQEYFSDGLTEEIITDLSHINDLLVISRSSAMTFKGTKKKIREIAKEVNVHYVLEGSVRKAGNKLRITAQLIDAMTDTHLWAEKYNGTLDDVFDIQEKVSRSIADELKIIISSEEKKKIQERPIDNVLAYDFYLRAYREIISLSKDRLDYALELLNKGLAIIGENALIYAGFAFTYSQYANLGYEQEENINKAEEYVRRTFAIDSNSAEANFVLGCINMTFQTNLHKAIGHFQRAHAIKPKDPEIMGWLSFGYDLVGKSDDAMDLADRVILIDPINPMNYAMKAIHHLFLGNFKIAQKGILDMHKIVPESSIWQLWNSIILLYNERPDETYEFINRNVKEPGQDLLAQLVIFLKYVLKGEKNKLPSLLTSDFLKYSQMDCQLSWHMATFYSYLDDKDQSLVWLNNAVARGFINYPFLSEHDKLLNNIRGEKRFLNLMKKVKYEWENFKV
ncbi:MAG: hypothetical protein QNK33_00495, partial [Bacteroidales bacterium]|nr:hypothetical protein [Bacteroidales bacterium]